MSLKAVVQGVAGLVRNGMENPLEKDSGVRTETWQLQKYCYFSSFLFVSFKKYHYFCS